MAEGVNEMNVGYPSYSSLVRMASTHDLGKTVGLSPEGSLGLVTREPPARPGVITKFLASLARAPRRDDEPGPADGAVSMSRQVVQKYENYKATNRKILDGLRNALVA